jgi:hypothetical protein
MAERRRNAASPRQDAEASVPTEALLPARFPPRDRAPKRNEPPDFSSGSFQSAAPETYRVSTSLRVNVSPAARMRTK